MNWRSLSVVATAGLLVLGCDKIPFLNQSDEAAQGAAAPDSTPAPATPVAPPSTPQASEPEPQSATQPAAQARRPVQTQVRATGEEPWFPSDTGTVRPGMTPDEVVGVWGIPVADRSMGNWLFLYYRNGCERACGTFDVVMFEGGQVVDAIVRGRGHTYAGTSSSPPNRVAEFTPPTMPRDTTGVMG